MAEFWWVAIWWRSQAGEVISRRKERATFSAAWYWRRWQAVMVTLLVGWVMAIASFLYIR